MLGGRLPGEFKDYMHIILTCYSSIYIKNANKILATIFLSCVYILP